MNVRDSEQIAYLLRGRGYELVDHAIAADLIILNTCSIREKAAQKIMSQLGRYRVLKQENPEIIIAVGGCLAQHMGETLLERVPHLDFVFGTHNIHLVPELVEQTEATRGKRIETAFHPVIPSMSIATPGDARRVSAFVTIMQGCNNYCAYCVVPFLRGPEQSRPSGDILAEIGMLLSEGVKEVTLLGQNVNSYGQTLSEEINFPILLRQIAELDGLERIRFTTSHPKDLSEELILCFGGLRVLCDHIHLPVQSGANTVLQAMNRKYTRETYLEKVARLREVCPGMAITTDIIVGFPGETDRDFEETLDLMDKIQFDNLFSFKYSEREGTAAASFPDKVPEGIKAGRLQTLQAHQEGHTLAKNQAMEGRVVQVLVEGRSKNSPEDMSGRTTTNKIVNFRGTEDMVGQLVPVRIKRGYLHSLRGEREG